VNAEQAQAILNHNNNDVRDVSVCGEVLNGEKVNRMSLLT
jgi:hypothetical protein